MDKVRMVGAHASHSPSSGIRASVIRRPLLTKTFASYTAWIVCILATPHLTVVSARGNFSVTGTSYDCFSNVICRGKAHVYNGNGSNGIENGRLSLIQEDAFWTHGIAYYNVPVQLLDQSTQQSASFNTSFTMDKVTGTSEGKPLIGDGMAFVISADNTIIGAEGEHLGIFNKQGITTFKSVIIEFDTRFNEDVFDISDNHVSLDLANISFAAAANASDVNVNMGDERTMFAWVEYDSQTLQLEVRLSNDKYRPVSALLSYKVNLFDVVEEFMWVGFSSSAGNAYTNYYIGDWTFDSYGIKHPDSFSAVALGDSKESKSSGRHLGLIVGSAVGVTSFLVVSVVIVLCLYRWSRGRDWQLGWSRSRDRDSVTMERDGMPEIFSYKQLSVATKAFRESSKLGQGAFGSVYRGVLPSSRIPVAVKKIKGDSSQGEKEFMAEVSIISQFRHRNLIQLLGWCKDESRGKYLLVYELMPNGSLDQVLFVSAHKHTVCLSWEQRFNIVTGTAAALDYLHRGSKQKVLHRDVKSSNIMLDREWNPKLADFGLARLVDHLNAPDTTLVAGTYGYLAPEVASSGKFTDKTDVFAFGAVVLELACGRRALATNLPADEVILVDWVWQRLSEDDLMSTVDKRLENYDADWMKVMLVLGLHCSHPNPLERPTMGQVVQILAGIVPVPSIPHSKPAFVVGAERQKAFLDYVNSSRSRTIPKSTPRSSILLTPPSTSPAPEGSLVQSFESSNSTFL